MLKQHLQVMMRHPALKTELLRHVEEFVDLQ